MPEIISLSKQLFLSPAEAEEVRNAIAGYAVGATTFEKIIDSTLTHRLEWCASQNFLAGFIIGRLLQEEEHRQQKKFEEHVTSHPGAPHAK